MAHPIHDKDPEASCVPPWDEDEPRKELDDTLGESDGHSQYEALKAPGYRNGVTVRPHESTSSTNR